MNNFIYSQVIDHIKTAEKAAASEEVLAAVSASASAITDSIKAHGKLLIAGNGGSAADSQHIAAEFVNRFHFDREAMPAIALTTDTSVLTAIGNDYSFDRVFARQINAFGREGDVFMALSTSGNSKNVVEALKECRRKSIKTIGLTGSIGGKMQEFCDIIIKVPSDLTPRIQEMHILFAHIICHIVEEAIFHNIDSGK